MRIGASKPEAKDFVAWYFALEHEFDGWYGVWSKIWNNKVTYGPK